METYKVLGNVQGVFKGENLSQGYRLVEFQRDDRILIGVEQQFDNGEWQMTCGQWCKEDVIEKDSIYIDAGQEWLVTNMQKVLQKCL